MRLLFVFIFSFFHFHFFAQSKDNVQIEYEFFCDTSSPIRLFTTLTVNKNYSVYQEKFSTARKWDEKAIPVPDGARVFGMTDPDEPYIKIDRFKKEIFFFDRIGANMFLIKDNYHELVWNINSSETKLIAGYNCIKATTDFRGRRWIAWFAPDIAMPFGPWKLHGLPGVILEAYDNTNKYTLKAVKIEFKKNNVLDKEFSSLIETQNTNPISFEKFLSDTEEAKQNLYMRLNEDRGATVTVLPVAREGMELKYEWEK